MLYLIDEITLTFIFYHLYFKVRSPVPRILAYGPKGPEETPFTPWNYGAVRRTANSRGSGTETTRPLPDVYDAVRILR